ncbi:hypothetical protein ACQWTT_001296 [Acinetobacter baumannii]
MQNRYVEINLKTQITKYLEVQNHHSFLLSNRYYIYIPDTITNLQVYKKHVATYAGLRRLLDQNLSLIFVRFFSDEFGLFNKEENTENLQNFEIKKILYSFITEINDFLKTNEYISEELYKNLKNYILQETWNLLKELKELPEDAEYFQSYTSQNLILPEFKPSV